MNDTVESKIVTDTDKHIGVGAMVGLKVGANDGIYVGGVVGL